MRTPREIEVEESVVYGCELERCLRCGTPLVKCPYYNGRKIVQTMNRTIQIAYQPKRCPVVGCPGHQESLKSAAWQQIAPVNGTYGYDVIAGIGWQRQTLHHTFGEIHEELRKRVQISEAQVRYLYTYQYQPLLACQERSSWAELQEVSDKQGLLLTLDGLAPEGGEAQLWLVRELRTGKTLRSGWLSEQGQTAFENFLEPIAAANLRVEAVMSDKQRGLVPAVAVVFSEAKHAFCQSHYLNNIAEPVARADEAMKVSLRKQVRADIGGLIRPEQVEQPGVLTVTGLLPTPIETEESEPLDKAEAEECEPIEPQAVVANPVEQEQADIETAIKRRIRYLLTLKGRPPFRLAGIEMYERLAEVADNLGEMVAHLSSPCLEQVRQGLEQALNSFKEDYLTVSQGANWLHRISELLDPTDKPARTGEQVQTALFNYLDDMQHQSQDNQILADFVQQIEKTSRSYQSGLFHSYDMADLPRTNNDRESEFRRLNQRLLRTTGQKGATRRLIQRSGAWELLPRPASLSETIQAIATVEHSDYIKERARVCSHRHRFRLHTRSVKQSQKQLQDLKHRWFQLPPDK